MQDPFPIPPIPALSRAVQPYADWMNVPSLTLHIHEVIFAALLYTFVQLVVSPWICMKYAPDRYPIHSRSKRINWDSHVVSMVQSCLINGLALWVTFVDEERRQMSWEDRIWAYDGASGFIAAFAAGYFVWDFIMTVTHLDVFGLGLLAHASSALLVYSFGFRPFLHYYSTVFILYELSTPLLNVHWFCDKLGKTGSRLQLYNGIALIFTFFCCRLVWGTYQSACVYYDMWRAIRTGPIADISPEPKLTDGGGLMAFIEDRQPIPLWLAGIYLAANMTLNTLNWIWFSKMIRAVRKRFEPPTDAPAKKEELDANRQKQEARQAQQALTEATGIDAMAEKMENLRKRAMSDIPVPEIRDDLSEMQ